MATCLPSLPRRIVAKDQTMKRPRLIAFCVLLMLMLFVAGSGFVFSQELDNVFNQFAQGYRDEFYSTDELNQKRIEYLLLTGKLRVENVPTLTANINEYTVERMKALGANYTAEESMQIMHDAHAEAFFENEYDLHQKYAEKEKEIFPDIQERQQRQFQLRESITKRLESFGSSQDIYSLVVKIRSLDHKYAQPDFLELTQEQKDLIKGIQKETALKISRIRDKSRSEQPEKLSEISQLVQRLNAMQAGEERNEITRKLLEIEVDMINSTVSTRLDTI